MLPYFWHGLIDQLKRQVEEYSFRCNDRRSRLSWIRFPASEFRVRKGQSYPLIDLTLSIADGLFVKCEYSYGADDEAHTKTWSDLIAVDHDKKIDRVTFMYKGEKFIREGDLARFLLLPLTDPNFVPPEAR